MKKVGFISLGCPKNLVDSEVMMGQLKAKGYEITSDAAEAETLVVNTCGFIDAAKKESVDAILEAARLKSEGSCKRVVVAGCLVERYRDELRAELPEVDAFIGTNQINDITTVCDAKVNTRALPVLPVGNQSATYLYDESSPRVLATPGHFAYVKIAEGCDRPCAFCFIPQMRGHFRSRRLGSVLAEAQALAARLAAGPTAAYRAIKTVLATAATDRLEETLALEARLQTDLGRTADHREAVEAFLGKRAPQFTGK